MMSTPSNEEEKALLSWPLTKEDDIKTRGQGDNKCASGKPVSALIPPEELLDVCTYYMHSTQ